MSELLWDWARAMALLLIVCSVVAAGYLLGRSHGRRAQARQTVRSAYELASAETLAILLPSQREPS